MVEEGVYVQTVVVASFADAIRSYTDRGRRRSSIIRGCTRESTGHKRSAPAGILLAQERRNARTVTSVFVGVGADRIREPQWLDHTGQHEY
jgi:hypothetical protein